VNGGAAEANIQCDFAITTRARAKRPPEDAVNSQSKWREWRFVSSPKPVCKSCETAHRRVFGPFFRALLASRAATPSNSPRIRLLEALHGMVCQRSKDEIRGKSYCRDALRSTASFDAAPANSRCSLLFVAVSLPLNASLGKRIVDSGTAVGIARILERLDAAGRIKVGREKQVADIATLLNHGISIVHGVWELKSIVFTRACAR
jgi:hypothetical protein